MLQGQPSFKCQRMQDPPAQASSSVPFQTSQIPNIPAPMYRGTGANAIRPPTLPPPTTYGRKRCPPLTHAEISLLNKHKGCRKCRRFYVSHRGTDCPNDFPDGAMYTPLSEETAFEAMRKLAVASTYGGTTMTTNSNVPARERQPSFSTQPRIPQSSFSDSYNSYFAPPAIPYSTPAPSVIDNSSAQIEEMTNTAIELLLGPSAAPVNAVLPSSSYPPFVLSGNSDTSGSLEDVSPISIPHLIWKAQIWDADDVQKPFDCLLDNGAHLVLIRPEVVTDLGLPICRLHNPVSVTLALNKEPKAVTEFYDYVSLSLSSLNNAWSLRPVRALLAPNLCSNILLGLPFLSHNKIVIDHASRTAIDKTCGFDLLNENSFCRAAKPPTKPLSPKQK